jgi:preprotein translocase subunit SecE
MDQQHQKFVNISYVVFAALIAYLVLAAAMKLSGVFDLESKIKSVEYIIRGGSIFIGVAIFWALYSNSAANSFMTDVAAELLTKVTWPTQKDTVAATGVVLVTVFIAGLILGLFDWIWAYLIKVIL